MWWTGTQTCLQCEHAYRGPDLRSCQLLRKHASGLIYPSLAYLKRTVCCKTTCGVNSMVATQFTTEPTTALDQMTLLVQNRSELSALLQWHSAFSWCPNRLTTRTRCYWLHLLPDLAPPSRGVCNHDRWSQCLRHQRSQRTSLKGNCTA